MVEKKTVFLKRETKSSVVVTSVILAIAVIALIISAVIVPEYLITICAIGSSVVVLVAAIAIGIVQIKVFKDYKSQKKALCAEGIFHICMSILIVITACIFLFAKLIEASIDLRYIIAVFIMAFVVWKIITAISAFKEKRNNAVIDVLLSVLWLISGVLLILTAAIGNDLMLILFAVSNFLLLVTEIVYMLFSYIFRTPNYLETPEGLQILATEQEERKIRLGRYNMMAGRIDVQPEPAKPQVVEQPKESTLKEKLAQLNQLKMEGVLTEEEYKEKRKQIIDSSL